MPAHFFLARSGNITHGPLAIFRTESPHVVVGSELPAMNVTGHERRSETVKVLFILGDASGRLINLADLAARELNIPAVREGVHCLIEELLSWTDVRQETALAALHEKADEVMNRYGIPPEERNF